VRFSLAIYSPGNFASSYKPEDYINGNMESEIRNAAISKILYSSKYIEQFGSGLKRIDRLCKDSGIKYSYENKENAEFACKKGIYPADRLQKSPDMGSSEISRFPQPPPQLLI
jgi:ATP-dependent DNA helicase RecG